MPTPVLEAYQCCRCKEMKPREAFGTRKVPKGDRTYRITRCKKCEVLRVSEKAVRHPHSAKERRKRSTVKILAQDKHDRLHRVKVERFIVKDSKAYDAKRGLKNDLKSDGVLDIISQPCVYCGESEIRMTLDRIDNDLGHVFANVVGCCVRCNMMRRHMPYAAWMRIVPSIRAAREEGLFQGWTGEVHRREPKHEQESPDLMQSLGLSIGALKMSNNDLVDRAGIEPATSAMPLQRSPS